MDKQIRITVLASGRGSNFMAVHNAIKNGQIKNAQLVHLITDRLKSGAASYATTNHMRLSELCFQSFAHRKEFDQKLAQVLDADNSDLYLTLGFMRILSPVVLAGREHKIVNIHPSLLPAFKGLHAQKQAFAYGVKISGCTVHYVDSGVDTGPIIGQAAVDISQAKSANEVADLILVAEHRLLVGSVKMLVDQLRQ